MIATQLATDSIAITRTFYGIEEAAHRIIERLGGMASVIRGARFALLKPNFVAGRSAETGSITSFALLKAVAEEVRACGAEPVLCETPGTEFDREATYIILGVEKFCAENGIRIVRVDPEGGDQDWVELRPPGARQLRRFHVPRFLQVLVAGRNSLAVDLVCCRLVGVKPHDIPHLRLALKQLGQPSWTLGGEDVGLIKQFRLSKQNVIDLKTLKVNYKTCQRCLLCYEACPENAISVKGYSGTRRPS